MSIIREMCSLLEASSGRVIAKTKSGKDIYQSLAQHLAANNGPVDDWTAQDHKDAEEVHRDASADAAYGRHKDSMGYDSAYEPLPKDRRGHHDAANYHEKSSAARERKAKK
jgi:hypothetical protein